MVHVVCFRPESAPPGWERTSLWHEAAALPGVRVVVDPGDVEASRFGVATSGHGLPYDVADQLRFRGGITPSRGRQGDNPGRDAVIAWLRGGRGETSAGVRFSCLLFAPAVRNIRRESP